VAQNFATIEWRRRDDSSRRQQDLIDPELLQRLDRGTVDDATDLRQASALMHIGQGSPVL